MKFTTRQLVLLAVFGALWGVVEISLGSVLHALKIPLSGAFLAAAGLTVALSGRWFVPVRGATFFIGVIALILKLFSIGGIVVGPMVGILAEAALAELVLSSLGKSRLTFLLAGGAGVLWSLAQPFVTGPILFGRGIFSVWLDTLDLASRLLGIQSGAAVLALAVFAVIHLVIGAIAGWMAWEAGRVLHSRMRGSEMAVSSSLVGLVVLALMTSACAPAAQTPPSQTLKVSGPSIEKTYTADDLKALGATEAAFKDVTYLGVPLTDLLKDAGFDLAAVKAVKVIASDGFTVNYEPDLFSKADTVVAYAQSEGPLSEEDGTFRMVLPGQEGKLNPRQIVEIQVVQ